MSRSSLVAFNCLSFTLLVIGCSEEPTIKPPDADNTRQRSSDLPLGSGEFDFEDGSKYKGKLINGKPDGVGERRFKNGNVYVGSFSKGRQSGEGIMYYRGDENLTRYKGFWKGGKRHGDGALEYADGSIEDGLWINDEFSHGKRTDGELVFEGVWEGSFFHGMVQFPDGKSFTGTLENDALKEGCLVNVDGDRYVGAFLEGLPHGAGSLEKADGELFVGQFIQGRYQGFGRQESVGGNVYLGEFSNGLPHGQGRQSDPTGVEYLGHWENGERQGSGMLTFPNGGRFTGNFENGLAVDGSYFWPDGRVTRSYQDEAGQWKDKTP